MRHQIGDVVYASRFALSSVSICKETSCFYPLDRSGCKKKAEEKTEAQKEGAKSSVPDFV